MENIILWCCGRSPQRSPVPALKMILLVEGAVLDGFGDVFGGECVRYVKIGDGTRDF